MTADLAIRCRDLRKTYLAGKSAVEAVCGLDLSVEPGACFGLLGPNGAGKTTTIEILEGILAPTSGEVEVLGMRWGTGRDQQIRRRLGITLQETRFDDKLTVREIVTLFRSFYPDGQSPEATMAAVELTEKATARVGRLSGGQKQRLALACGLVGNPALLFLDEPTTGLDPQSRREVWKIVRAHQARGATTLLTTHYMHEAEVLCDRVAIVDHGRIIAEGTPADLIARLGGEHVVEFAANATGDGGAAPAALDEAALAALPSVTAVRRERDAWLLTVHHPHVAIPELLRRLAGWQAELNRLTTRHASLEDVFVALTGRTLDADDATADSSAQGTGA
ncbi:MAG: ABC transporter ATP-binding protein [Phycisphaerales bacterium]|nr:ABC transporter ATP-binding protein [Phycisphaerales bacterium]